MMLMHLVFLRFLTVSFTDTPRKPHNSVNTVHHIDLMLKDPISQPMLNIMFCHIKTLSEPNPALIMEKRQNFVVHLT